MRKLRTIEMQRLTLEEFRAEAKLPLIVVLDNVRSLYNVGSVFRTCDAFRVEAVYLCGITATPPNAEIHKTALGGEDSVAWRYFATPEEAVDDLHEQGYFVYSVEQCEGSTKLQDFGRGEREEERGKRKKEGGKRTGLPFESEEKNDEQNNSLSSFLSPLSSKYAVVFGNEVKGVKQSVVDASDGCLEIPQFGTKHSLNVSVTAGIVVWEFAKRLFKL